jgi:hypothetical protein
MKTKILLLSFTYSLFLYVLINWNNFDDCYGPIQISLISATSLILGRYCLKCARILLNERFLVKFITFLIIWVIPILLIMTVVAGLIWVSQNMEYTDTCGTEILPPGITIFILTLVFFLDLYFIYGSIVETFNWNLLRRNHRRIRNDIDTHFDVISYMVIEEDVSQIKLTEAQLQALEVKKCKKSFSMLEVCAICAMDYQEGEELIFVPGCTHHYHSGCLKVWLKMNSTCPSCRNDISKYLPSVNV